MVQCMFNHCRLLLLSRAGHVQSPSWRERSCHSQQRGYSLRVTHTTTHIKIHTHTHTHTRPHHTHTQHHPPTHTPTHTHTGDAIPLNAHSVTPGCMSTQIGLSSEGGRLNGTPIEPLCV